MKKKNDIIKKKIVKKLKQKIGKKKKKNKTKGWLQPFLGLKWGGWDHPILAKGVVGATPMACLGVVEPPPWPRGWSGQPLKAKKKKKKKKSLGFGPLRMAGPPPRAKTQTFLFLFFVFWPFKGGWTTPLAMGVVLPPLDKPWGWLQPPPWPKWGGPATPFWPKGVAKATLFIFFLIFLVF
jgi:hypothetical protein